VSRRDGIRRRAAANAALDASLLGLGIGVIVGEDPP
jgi:hypothetical protein